MKKITRQNNIYVPRATFTGMIRNILFFFVSLDFKIHFFQSFFQLPGSRVESLMNKYFTVTNVSC